MSENAPGCEDSTSIEPSTLRPTPYTPNPKPYTLNPKRPRLRGLNQH